jgi:hypothetical protein
MGMWDYDYILGLYRKLWNNRQLNNGENAEDILKEAIIRELKDENSHPRIRRSAYEKYYLATKRILDSSLENDDKILLFQLYAEYKRSIE